MKFIWLYIIPTFLALASIAIGCNADMGNPIMFASFFVVFGLTMFWLGRMSVGLCEKLREKFAHEPIPNDEIDALWRDAEPRGEGGE